MISKTLFDFRISWPFYLSIMIGPYWFYAGFCEPEDPILDSNGRIVKFNFDKRTFALRKFGMRYNVRGDETYDVGRSLSWGDTHGKRYRS